MRLIVVWCPYAHQASHTNQPEGEHRKNSDLDRKSGDIAQQDRHVHPQPCRHGDGNPFAESAARVQDDVQDTSSCCFYTFIFQESESPHAKDLADDPDQDSDQKVEPAPPSQPER